MLFVLWLAPAVYAQTGPYGFGKPATPEEVKKQNITVFPDGAGLRPGKGTAAAGRNIFREKCAECHNDNGEGREGQYPALVGGIGSLGTAKPKKTVGSYWPYATTVWDHISRAMPFDHPHTLSPDDVYSVTAFILFLNGIVPETQELNEKNLSKVVMPNRNGFIPDPRPDIKAQR